MKTVYDHINQQFPSISAMCEYWGVNQSTYQFRIQQGLSVEEALTTKRKKRKKQDGIACNDGEHQYSSIVEAAKAMGVNPSTLYKRHSRGKDMFEQKTYRDHTGREFSSFLKMCTAWGHAPNTVRCRLRRGWSLKDALEKEWDKYKGIACSDGENEYKSRREAARAYGLPQNLINQRINKGKSQDELFGPYNPGKGTTVYDLEGNRYRSINELCRICKIYPSSIRYKANKMGISLQEAINIILAHKGVTNGSN